jgi:mycoredoxin
MPGAEAADQTAVLFYWRPGCPFCSGLERGLTRLGVPFEKRNIWDDPASAAVVRSHANGNETVPTVVIGDVGMVNPSADEVVAVLAVKAPELVPEGWEPPQPGRIGRALGRILDR